MRGLASAVAAICTTLVAAAPAGAAPTWLAPSPLSAPGQSADTPQVSVNGRGDALAVWRRLDPKSAHYVIEASGRPAGSGSWQTPVTISDTKHESSLPVVGIDAAGDAVAVWLSFDGSEYSIEAATRPGLGGSWQKPVTLHALGATTVTEPQPDLAVDANGDAVAIWERLEGAEDLAEAAAMPAGGSWRAAETLSKQVENLHTPEVAIDAAGDATAVWEENIGGVVRIDASTKRAGGKWQTAVTLSAAPGNANEARVAMNARGDAVAVWERFEGEEHVEVAGRPVASGGWEKPVALTQPELNKGEPAAQQVAIDGQGNAVVVWSRADMKTKQDFIEAAVGQISGAAFKSPVMISGPGGNVEEGPIVAADGKGDAIVVWEQSNGSNDIVQATSGLAASGSWQTPVPLSATGQSAGQQQVALDAQGDAAAIWTRVDGKATNIAEAAGYDAAGPALGSLAIPGTGTVGQSLAFSVSPLDVWSALGATTWSFGDGTGQTGAAVAHTFTAPGTYTVTVTGADVLGNATSSSAEVSISAAEPKAKPSPRAPTGIDVLRNLVISPATLVAADSGPSVRAARTHVAKRKAGAIVSYTGSSPATTTFTVQRPVAGRLSGRNCVKLAKRNAGRRRCQRYVNVGAFTHADLSGANRFRFSGRVAGSKLPPGTYRLRAVPRNAAGSGLAVYKQFRVNR